MPMYFPDLKSVKSCAVAMQKNKNEKKYHGIVPHTDDDLPEARVQLASYMRDIWNDEIAAMEIELAVTEENYEEKLRSAIARNM